MKNPKLIVKPFAKNGQKNVIPENYETSMESNQATWDQGFGQITMLPVAAGGLPPKGQDFNGILNQISENIVYLSQGGRFKFSAEYAEAIGGYPKGAILQSDDEKKEYLSLIDNNKVNFNTAADISASWKLVNTDDLLAQIASKQPKGDYATKTELNNGLAGKQPVGDYFEKTSVVQNTGASTTSVMSQAGSTKAFADKTSLSEQEFKAQVVSPALIAGSVNGGSLRVVFKDGKPYFSINIGDLWYQLDVPFESAGLSTREPGDFELTGRRTSQLRKGYYSPNGDLFDLTSPQGKALNALSAEFKSDWGIAVSGGKINMPNIKQSDSRTPFIRLVNGSGRLPGSIEQDAMRNFTGSFEVRNYAQYPMVANPTGVFSSSSLSSDLFSVKEGGPTDPKGTHRVTMDPSRALNAANIANEFRALNIGMNLAFYLGV